jgi:hypothetical protein
MLAAGKGGGEGRIFFFATTWQKRFFRQSAILSSACLVQSVILSSAYPIFRPRQGRLDVARSPLLTGMVPRLSYVCFNF